jgi:hypothetical protein
MQLSSCTKQPLSSDIDDPGIREPGYGVTPSRSRRVTTRWVSERIASGSCKKVTEPVQGK